MDPLTQGAIGAAVPQATRNAANVRVAGLLGFLSGMAADLDILIRSSEDQLLFLEYHRQFTHSLIFIPLGGLLCAVALHWLLGARWKLTYVQTWLFCTLGFATHALLDTTTSYGTMLLWPFSDERFSWSIIPVVDPYSPANHCIGDRLRYSPEATFCTYRISMGGPLSELGFMQHNAAYSMAEQIAADQGHAPIRIVIKPSFANILVWRTVYETSDRFYVDAVRVGISPKTYPGASIEKLDLTKDFPWLDPGSQQARDIKRFAKFSKGYIAKDPQRPLEITDVRYAFLPNEISALWSIELSPDASVTDYVKYRTHREDARGSAKVLWRMIIGN